MTIKTDAYFPWRQHTNWQACEINTDYKIPSINHTKLFPKALSTRELKFSFLARLCDEGKTCHSSRRVQLYDDKHKAFSPSPFTQKSSRTEKYYYYHFEVEAIIITYNHISSLNHIPIPDACLFSSEIKLYILN